MNYKETIEFLYAQLPAYHRIGKAAYKNNLQNTQALDDYFNHPHKKYLTVHVGGTNGKGSVSHMAASVLQEAGYRTGLYTSPHLKDFRERIRINGEMIPEHEVISFVQDHSAILRTILPSFFEMSVAMALDYFARENVDIAVIEVGLGGRLDSTNIITPLVSVITNIGHDHMDLLGDSLEKIAIEKAGIIKRGVPVVIGEKKSETMNVFVSSAKGAGSQVYFAEEHFNCDLEGIKSGKLLRHYKVIETKSKRLLSGTIPLGGDYQAANITTIFQLFRCLEPHLNISGETILNGIGNVVKNTGLQGRWQVLGTDPLIICDTGHNLEGLKWVIKQLTEIHVSKRHFVIGFVSDKDLNSVLPLFPSDSEYYFTKASVPRAMDEKKLMADASKYGLNGRSYSTVMEAFNAAKEIADISDLIFVGGSTFVVSEVL